MTLPPPLDSIGRSYGQVSQTPGALGGRRDVVQWYGSGVVSSPNRQIVKVAGAAWRLLVAEGYVVTAPTLAPVVLDIEAKLPGEVYESIFITKPTIPIGEFTSTGGVIRTDRRILPIGTLVKQGGVGAATELLVALGLDATPREQSRLVGGVWDGPLALPAGITNTDPEIMVTNASVWFVINSDDVSDAYGWGVGARSKDGGDTWSATPDPGVGNGGIKWVERDVGGRLWCIVHDSHSVFRRTKIYYSDNDGDSWVLSTTHGTGAPSEQVDGWRIIVHPTDQDTIAIIGYQDGVTPPGGTVGFILITKNRGASWTVNTSVDIRRGQSAQWGFDAVMLSDGRIVAQGPFVVQATIKWDTWYSDDDGVTWTLSQRHLSNSLRMNGMYISSNEDTIAYTLTDILDSTKERIKIWLSTDQGATFSEISLTVEIQEFVGLSDLFSPARFIASGVFEAMYISTNQSPIEVIKLSPVNSGGIVTDLTDAYPHISQGNDNLGIVPGDPVSGAQDLSMELHYRTRAVSQ